LIQLIQSFKENLFSEKEPQQSSILAVLWFLFGSLTKQDQPSFFTNNPSIPCVRNSSCTEA